MSDVKNLQGQPSYLGIALALGLLATALLALPALYNLLVAVQEALTTGLVRVNATRRGGPRQLVPWQHAWAHFLGLSLLTLGGLWILFAFKVSQFRGPLPLIGFIVAIAAAPIGLPLWRLSGSLTTLSSTLFFFGSFTFIAVVMYVGNKFGRVAAVTLIILAFAFMSWKVVAVPNTAVEPAPRGAVHVER